jgi:[acyl-carrier-protein] S-malonyltransferase
MNAYVFPGQGSQFPGMGKEYFDNHPHCRQLFLEANDVLGFSITDTMFSGSEEDLRQTKVTQPAVFLHSVAAIKALGESFSPHMVAGHSLGEFSALVANACLSFSDALLLVSKRAFAMQKACEQNPSTMAAILGLDDKIVEQICADISSSGKVVVAANYNCPGQLVISGSMEGIQEACEKMKAAGAKRALPLQVGGAFHSPLMEPAKEELKKAIEETTFRVPVCPVYQNVNALPSTDPEQIKSNLVEQLTAPVRWTQTIERMIADGANHFYEAGPGKVLQGLVKKVNKDAIAESC